MSCSFVFLSATPFSYWIGVEHFLIQDIHPSPEAWHFKNLNVTLHLFNQVPCSLPCCSVKYPSIFWVWHLVTGIFVGIWLVRIKFISRSLPTVCFSWYTLFVMTQQYCLQLSHLLPHSKLFSRTCVKKTWHLSVEFYLVSLSLFAWFIFVIFSVSKMWKPVTELVVHFDTTAWCLFLLTRACHFEHFAIWLLQFIFF